MTPIDDVFGLTAGVLAIRLLAPLREKAGRFQTAMLRRQQPHGYHPERESSAEITHGGQPSVRVRKSQSQPGPIRAREVRAEDVSFFRYGPLTGWASVEGISPPSIRTLKRRRAS